MLKYLKQFKGQENWEEISHDAALATLLTTFKDSDMTRDMLTIPNWIPCRFSTIQVRDDNRVAMPGLTCLLPMGYEYDESGNRI